MLPASRSKRYFKLHKPWVLLGRRLGVADTQGPRKLHAKKKTGIFLKREKKNDPHRNPFRGELISYFKLAKPDWWRQPSPKACYCLQIHSESSPRNFADKRVSGSCHPRHTFSVSHFLHDSCLCLPLSLSPASLFLQLPLLFLSQTLALLLHFLICPYLRHPLGSHRLSPPPYATTIAKLLTQLPPELWAYQQFFMLPVGSLWFITVPKKKGLKGSHCSPKTPSLSFWDSEFWAQSWSFLAPHRAKSKESGSGMSNNSLNWRKGKGWGEAAWKPRPSQGRALKASKVTLKEGLNGKRLAEKKKIRMWGVSAEKCSELL